jgi:AcrR family transcriptional regulator
MATSLGTRRTRRSEGTKDEIIRAAAKMFAAQGYEATSLDSIAAEAGMTKATLYYHFSSKETIYAAVLTRYLAEAKERLEEVRREGGGIPKVFEGVIEALLDDTLSPSKRYVQYQEIIRIEPDIRAIVRRAQRDYETTLARIVEDAQDAGLIIEGDPHLIAMLIIGTIGRTAKWYRPEGRIGIIEFRATVSQLLIYGLLKRN